MKLEKLMAVLAISLCGGVFAGDNLVKNGTFEGTATANAWGSYANASGFSCANWTFHNTARAGLGKPNGTWMASGLDVGTYALFIQTVSGSGTCKVSQDIALPGPGIYQLSFKYTARPQYNPITTKILFGSQEIGSVNTTATSLQTFSKSFTVTSGGTQTLAFSQDATSYDRANVFEGVDLHRLDVVVDDVGYENFAAGMAMAGTNSTFVYTVDGANVAFNAGTYTWNGNLPKVTVPGTLTVNGAVKIVAYGATPGTYTLLEAGAISFADGATLTLDDTVTDALTRTLTQEDGKLILTVARKDYTTLTEYVANGAFDLPGTQCGANDVWAYENKYVGFALPGWTGTSAHLNSQSYGLSTANNTWLVTGQTNGGTYSLYFQGVADAIAQTVGPVVDGVYRLTFNVASRSSHTGAAVAATLVKDGTALHTLETEAINNTIFTNTGFVAALPANVATAETAWGVEFAHRRPDGNDRSAVIDDVSFRREAVPGWSIGADNVTTLSGAAEVPCGSYIAGAATIAAGATPVMSASPRAASLTVAGTLTIAGAVVVTVTDAAALHEGAYTLVQADALTFAEGATFTLDPSLVFQSGTGYAYSPILDVYSDRIVLRIYSSTTEGGAANNYLKPTSERTDTLWSTASSWSRAHAPDSTDANYICYFPGTLQFDTSFTNCTKTWYFRNGFTAPIILAANDPANGIASSTGYQICGGINQTGWLEFRSGTYTGYAVFVTGSGSNTDAHGRVDFTGATVTMGDCLQCGYGVNAVSEVNISAGTVWMKGAYNSNIETGSRTTLNITGGTFMTPHMQLLAGMRSRLDAVISGGEVILTDSTGMVFGYNSVGASGLFTLSGGRLTMDALLTRGDVTLLANGGALAPYSNTTTWLTGGTVTVANGAAAILDTDGKDATLGATLVDTAGGNALAVTKRGLGTLTLDGDQTFTGALRVEGGKLLALGSVAASDVTVTDGGCYSLVNGTVNATVRTLPALTLTGGARLGVDVDATGADAFAPSTLDTSALSAATPAVIDVNLIGIAELPADVDYCVLTGVAAGDAAKFTVMGADAITKVKDGALYITSSARTKVAVEWSGAAEDGGKWSTGGNWTGGEVPLNGDTAVFNLAAGGTTLFDATGLAFGGIRFGATAGAFVETGDEMLKVFGAITNLSENVQTFEGPVTLGVEGQTVIVDATGDVVLTGAVTTAGTLVKTGTGSLNVQDTALLSAKEVVVKGGSLRVDERTGEGAKDGVSQAGTIRVETGGRLDVNLANGNGTLAKVEATHGKTVEIAGSGPDGEGAIYNSTDGTGWCAQLGKVVLTGDATVGGGHASVRPVTGSLIPDATLEGPHTLTVKTTKDTDGFNLHTIKLDVNEIDVVGKLMFEQAASGVVSNGIHLTDGSALRLYAATLPATIPVTVDENAAAELITQSADAPVRGAMTIESGATLTASGGKAARYEGVVTNDGTYNLASGNWACLYGPGIAGAGTYTANGALVVGGTVNSPDATLTVAGNGLIYLGADCDAQLKTYGYPTLGSVDSTFTGTVILQPGVASVVSNEMFSPVLSTAGTVHLYHTNPAATTTVTRATWNIKNGSFYGAHNNLSGKLVLGAGANMTCNGYLYLQEGTKPAEAYIEVGPGATLTYPSKNNGFQMARCWQNQTRTRATTTVRVSGGTLDAANATILVGTGGGDAWLDLVSGSLAVNQMDIIHSVSYKDNWKDASNQRFTQQGGQLELGSGGFRSCYPSRGNVHADLANGTLVANGNIANSYAYVAPVFGADPRGTGDYTLDLNGKTVNWNGPLAGASDVTITGAGTFSSTVRLQSIPLGKWTITNTTEQAFLTGAAGFASGLTLAPDTSAAVDIATGGLMEYGFFSSAQFSNFDSLIAYDGPLSGTVNEMRQMAQYYASESAKTPGNYTMGIARGEFEVPADKAGTWYFAGNTDDHVALIIDDTTVFKTTGWTNVGTGSKALTAGWHTFRVCTYDITGASGPATGDWKDGLKLVGWTTDAAKSGSTTAADYSRFDTDTLNMRIPSTEKARTGVRVSVKGAVGTGNASTYNTGKDAYAAYEYVTNTMAVVNGHSSQSTVFKPACGTNVRTEGFFHVDAAQVGDWTFTVCYDDRITLDIDGTRLVESTSWQAPKTATRTLAAGWHAFTIYTYDGSTVATGGFGGTTKDDNNVVCAVKAKAAGAAKTLAFDGANFKIAANALQAAKHVEMAGLGEVTELGAGATLQNRSRRGSCPIYGTLKGDGALDGAFAFAGTNSVLALTGKSGKLTVKPDFTSVTDTAYLKELAHIELAFPVEKATTRYYVVASAGDLTAEEAAGIVVRVTNPNGEILTDWTATVTNGNLTLVNPHPMGCIVYLR